MIRISIKFSHSDSKEGKYVIYFKNGKIHHRQNNYYQYNATENNLTLSFEFSKPQNCNNNYLLEINDYNKSNIVDLHKTSKDKSSNNFFSFMENIIFSLKENGKRRTSETYYTTLNSFKHFRNNNDLAIDEINSNMIQMYETYLLNKGLTRNSSSFYMRILRAVYNRAVEKELTANRNPFKHVYTGIDKTVKRAIPLNLIKQIRKIDLSLQPSLDFARDMFLFSFYTRGMSFIDMAYLKKKSK